MISICLCTYYRSNAAATLDSLAKQNDINSDAMEVLIYNRCTDDTPDVGSKVSSPPID